MLQALQELSCCQLATLFRGQYAPGTTGAELLIEVQRLQFEIHPTYDLHPY